MHIFETHAHYDDSSFDSDREQVIASLSSFGVSPVINAASTMESNEKCLELAHRYPDFYAALGVHPSELSGISEGFFDHLKTYLDDEKVVAIGEIGLDYHYLSEEEDKESAKETQKKWLSYQLDIALEKDLPVIFHLRDSAAESMEILKKAACDGIRGVLHCYSYSPEQALEYEKMGYYFGIGGVVTFKNSKKLKETVERVDLSRILLETDCPYLAPEPFRGRRNDSTYLPYVVGEIAKIRQITENEVIEQTRENARTLFSRVRVH